jgi:hypothetical protein
MSRCRLNALKRLHANYMAISDEDYARLEKEIIERVIAQ